MNRTIFSFSSILLVILLQLFISNSQAQIAKGQWRDHLPYNTAHTIALAGNKVYCASEHSMFYYDKSDKSVHRMSKTTGLSDLGIGYIAFSDEYNSLIIGYINGNVDIIKNGKKYNIPDIKNKDILASKEINHIYLENEKAYLSCGFGIVLIDINKLEVTDTYVIGPSGSFLGINASIIFEQNIFALTETGVLKADKDDPFLSYFDQWTKETSLSNYSENFNSVTIFNNQLFVSNNFTNTDSCTVQAFNGNSWQVVFDDIKVVKSISSSNNQLIITNRWHVDTYNQAFERLKHATARNGQHALLDEEDYLWVADSKEGLLIRKTGVYVNPIAPSGPKSDRVFDIHFNTNEMLVAPGGYIRTGYGLNQAAEIYVFSDEDWSLIGRKNNPDAPLMNDLVCFASQSGNSNNYYAGTWGFGLVEINNNSISNIYTSENTDNILGNYVSGCTYDNDGNLWLMNRNRENSFVVKTTDNNWYSYNYGGLWGNTDTYKIIYTSYGDFWTISNRGNGYFVWNSNDTPENGADDTYRKRALLNDKAEVIDKILNDIVQDLEGSIWIATSNGVAVYDNPQQAIESDQFYARVPQIVIDGYLKGLLEGEEVTSIAVDGANRKWFGTKSGGLFLVSADGTEQLQIYNTLNSPLLSNSIKTLEINSVTGELFVGTDKGIISFMTTATAGKESFSKIYAFPNPVKGNYDGLITIRGLMYETNVKITDLSGQLVFETTSNGGDAVWNGRDKQGNLVSSGVYLVLCTIPDGSKSEVTKIMIVR